MDMYIYIYIYIHIHTYIYVPPPRGPEPPAKGPTCLYVMSQVYRPQRVPSTKKSRNQGNQGKHIRKSRKYVIWWISYSSQGLWSQVYRPQQLPSTKKISKSRKSRKTLGRIKKNMMRRQKNVDWRPHQVPSTQNQEIKEIKENNL